MPTNRSVLHEMTTAKTQVRLILRDMSGRHSWDYTLLYGKNDETGKRISFPGKKKSFFKRFFGKPGISLPIFSCSFTSYSPSFSFSRPFFSFWLFSPTPLLLPFIFILFLPPPASLHPSKFSHSTTFFIGLLQGLSVALQPLSSKEAKKSPTRKHVLKELRAASSPFTPDRLDEVGT